MQIKKEPYCQHIPRHRYEKERKEKEWETKAEYYINSQNWNYDFENEASLSDREQSFLCRFVYAKLMGFVIDPKSVPANGIVIEKDGLKYYFDVMNHSKDKIKEYENYHSIGNFAPAPGYFPYETWDGKVKVHIQLIHKWKNEKWDVLLKYMRANWNSVRDNNSPNNELPTFNEYMIASCQQLYFESIFDSFYNAYQGKSLEKVDWKSCIDSWNQTIKNMEKDNSELAIISIKESDKIEFLIEARGRCIMNILSNVNQQIEH